MKKFLVAAVIVMTFVLGALGASADTFNNSAFIGTWLSSGATQNDYGKLTIYYFDSDSFNCSFVYKKESRPTDITYTIYQGVVNDTYATAKFSVSNDNVKDYAYGTMEMYLYSAQIKVKLQLDNGILMYEGFLNPQMGFDPYTTAYNHDVAITLNGEPLETDKKPIVIRDRTYVPVRGVFEACGINVFWDDFDNGRATQQITFTRDDIISQIKRLNSLYGYGYEPWLMDVWSGIGATTEAEPKFGVDISDIQPIIIDTVSYMPLRAIAQTFGIGVDWIAETRTVNLTCNTDMPTKKNRDETDAIEDFNAEAANTVLGGVLENTVVNPTPYFTVTKKYYSFGSGRVYNDGTIE